MGRPKLVILRGGAACGKSTALYRLKKNKKFKDWAIIDNCSLKLQFENLGGEKMKEYGHGALFFLLKTIMSTKRNIIVDEMSEKTLRKNINYYINKYEYEIVTFQFAVSVETAIKREVHRRESVGLKSRGASWVKRLHKFHEEKIDKNGILINTDRFDKKGVEKFIIKNLKQLESHN